MNNPYRARGVPYRPWLTVDYYGGQRIVRGRYWWRWHARVASMGILKVEYGPDQDS